MGGGDKTMYNKKKWKSPRLIVLVRGSPEEGALGCCKLWYPFSNGPGNYMDSCNTEKISPSNGAHYGESCSGCRDS